MRLQVPLFVVASLLSVAFAAEPAADQRQHAREFGAGADDDYGANSNNNINVARVAWPEPVGKGGEPAIPGGHRKPPPPPAEVGQGGGGGSGGGKHPQHPPHPPHTDKTHHKASPTPPV
ncbi:hypothetical protein PG990_005358 [Apiospora arundinis]|uniref:Uncharacterized protein n=1 Tax=Apiospora arundinis TaxID=335852 RepID=A0ABR2J786_9PEZI